MIIIISRRIRRLERLLEIPRAVRALVLVRIDLVDIDVEHIVRGQLDGPVKIRLRRAVLIGLQKKPSSEEQDLSVRTLIDQIVVNIERLIRLALHFPAVCEIQIHVPLKAPALSLDIEQTLFK